MKITKNQIIVSVMVIIVITVIIGLLIYLKKPANKVNDTIPTYDGKSENMSEPTTPTDPKENGKQFAGDEFQTDVRVMS
jgi:hypothetical protein